MLALAENSDMSGRLAAVLAHTHLSQRQFALQLGVGVSFMSEIVRGKARPSLDCIVGVATHWPSINLNWLLTGQGEMLMEGGERIEEQLRSAYLAVEAANNRADELASKLVTIETTEPKFEDYQSALERELVKLWGVGEIALVARNGGHAYTRTLLRYLVSQYPQPIPLDHLLLADLDGAHRIDVVAALAVLVRKGLVTKEGSFYSVPNPDVELSSDDMPELHQQALEAVREILTTILPITDHHRDRGRLVLSDVYVPDGKELARQVMDAIKSVIDKANDTPGPERVSFVLGLAIDTPATLGNI